MAVYFLDSSALVKRYITKTGSAWVLGLNDLSKDYQIVEITEVIINSGMALAESYGLRGYDAIQLAVGRVVNSPWIGNGLPPITFVSTDNELNAAIIAEGLIIENPNDPLS